MKRSSDRIFLIFLVLANLFEVCDKRRRGTPTKTQNLHINRWKNICGEK